MPASIARRLTRALLVLPVLVPAAAARADLPPLVPRKVMFALPERTAPKLSPDGTRLSYLGRGDGELTNVFVRTLGKDDDRQVTSSTHRPIGDYVWAGDAEHVLYLQDQDGNEDWHLYATHVGTGETRNLTPFAGVRASNVIVDPAFPKAVLVGLNRRDPRVIDMHRIHIDTGDVTLEAENPGGVVEWVTDPSFRIRACAAIDDDARAILRVRDTADGAWRVLRTWPFEEAGFDRYQRIVGFTPGGKGLLVQSSIGSNTTRIVRIDLATDRETEVVPADPACDLWNLHDYASEFMPAALLRRPDTGAIQAYGLYCMKPEWRVLDESIRPDLDRLGALGGVFHVVDRDRDDRRWLVHVDSDTSSSAYYLYDRTDGSTRLLFHSRPELANHTWAPRRVVRYTARDGLEIPAFLTLPVGVAAKNLPLVVMPHGGPWFRDPWGFDADAQWLANRGYAVLQPQFRGSIGFGKAFVAASNGEMGVGHMQHDLSDGVAWAVAEGIADPKRVGIFGASYGGYAVLAGLAFTPELYACGVNVVGVSNMKTSFEAFPPYWAPRLQRWLKRVGNVLEDDALNRRISPVFHADQIRAPLLIGHGANDARVSIEESNQIVEAMRARNLPVTYVVYPDEGHGFARPANARDFDGRVEEFLARHLGGRAEPWVAQEGASTDLR